MPRALATLVFALLLASTAVAQADDPGGNQGAPTSAARSGRARQRGSEPRVLRLGEIVVPGWIHNPGVLFVLERTRPRFAPKPLERSFLTEGVRSTRGL